MSEETPENSTSNPDDTTTSAPTTQTAEGFPGKWIVVGLIVIALVVATGTYLVMTGEHGIAMKGPVEIPAAPSSDAY